MPSSRTMRFLASLPNEDGLYAALEKMEAADAASITILRKRSRYEPLRNIISGLWFAVLYRAVERHTGCAKATRKGSRCQAIHHLMICLRAGNEISGHNNNISKTVSKRMRSGLASWSTLSQEPSLLAIIDFSNPPSKEDLHDLNAVLEHSDLRHSTNCYRAYIQRILRFIDKTLRRTEILYRFLERAIQDVIDLVNSKTHARGSDAEDTSTGLVSEHIRSRDEMTGMYPFGFDSSETQYSISLEAAFNKSTHPRYTVQYDSPIFICVQSGDIHGVREFFEQGMASIHDVDPYNLGLLYVIIAGDVMETKAILMCRMLVQTGADLTMTDEIGNAPIHTMTDSAMVESRSDLNDLNPAAALVEVGLFCNLTSQDLIEEHQCYYNFTSIHNSLLGLNSENSSLQGHLHSLQRLGSLAELIDKPDLRGRSALAWAVEYGMADSVRTLLSFGANAGQYRRTSRSQFPLLHLVIAGPSPPLTSGSLEVVRILLATSIDINAKDDEGWSAWHVAASWRSYGILREIMRTHGTCVELDARTNDGASAHDLSQDGDFYRKLMPNWCA